MEANSAILKCTEFMDAWKAEDWKRLLKHCQITWVEDGHPKMSALRWIKEWYGSRPIPISAEVVDYQLKTQTTVDAIIKVKISGEVKFIRARIICEKEAYKPSPDGIWGVNPVSCLRMDAKGVAI